MGTSTVYIYLQYFPENICRLIHRMFRASSGSVTFLRRSMIHSSWPLWRDPRTCASHHLRLKAQPIVWTLHIQKSHLKEFINLERNGKAAYLFVGKLHMRYPQPQEGHWNSPHFFFKAAQWQTRIQQIRPWIPSRMILTHLQVCQCRLNYCNFRGFQQEVFVPLSCSLSLHLPKEVLSLQLFGGWFRSAIQRRFRRGTFLPGSIVSSTPLASQRWDCFHRNQCIPPMRPIRKGR